MVDLNRLVQEKYFRVDGTAPLARESTQTQHIQRTGVSASQPFSEYPFHSKQREHASRANEPGAVDAAIPGYAGGVSAVGNVLQAGVDNDGLVADPVGSIKSNVERKEGRIPKGVHVSTIENATPLSLGKLLYEWSVGATGQIRHAHGQFQFSRDPSTTHRVEDEGTVERSGPEFAI